MFAALLWPSLLLLVVLVGGLVALLAVRWAYRPRSSEVFRHAAIASMVCAAAAAKAQTVVCDGACTVTHVVTLEVPVLNIDPEGGAAVASAILALWGVAWGFRTLIRFLRDSDGVSPTSESE